MRFVALSLALLSSTLATAATASIAAADDDLSLARQDIVDARYGREPQRVQMLGFDADGAAYVRTTLCEVGDASALLSCKVTVDRLAADGHRRTTTLLDVSDGECGERDCANVITYRVARDFLVAEQALRASLPPLTAGTPITDGAHALGPDISLAVEHSLPAGPIADEDAANAGRMKLVARRGDRLMTLWRRTTSVEERLEDSGRIQAWMSPDGARVVLAASFATGVMCWGPFAEIELAQADVEAVRAKLARP